VIGALAATLGLVEPGTVCGPSELVSSFSLERLGRVPARVDLETLHVLDYS
jgi:hypothetical protein